MVGETPENFQGWVLDFGKKFGLGFGWVLAGFWRGAWHGRHQGEYGMIRLERAASMIHDNCGFCLESTVLMFGLLYSVKIFGIRNVNTMLSAVHNRQSTCPFSFKGASGVR
mmetsp:Transcript_6063/g.10903  ORF Transcript_6063/g.10903 Transcript_6063/m.10903 type:complete len:111 (-) Transcript_6063:963-1295(-)